MKNYRRSGPGLHNVLHNVPPCLRVTGTLLSLVLTISLIPGITLELVNEKRSCWRQQGATITKSPLQFSLVADVVASVHPSHTVLHVFPNFSRGIVEQVVVVRPLGTHTANGHIEQSARAGCFAPLFLWHFPSHERSCGRRRLLRDRLVEKKTVPFLSYTKSFNQLL